MMESNALVFATTASARDYFENMMVELADGLHGMYGVEFVMNDGRLVGVRGINVVCGTGMEAGKSFLLPAT